MAIERLSDICEQSQRLASRSLCARAHTYLARAQMRASDPRPMDILGNARRALELSRAETSEWIGAKVAESFAKLMLHEVAEAECAARAADDAAVATGDRISRKHAARAGSGRARTRPSTRCDAGDYLLNRISVRRWQTATDGSGARLSSANSSATKLPERSVGDPRSRFCSFSAECACRMGRRRWLRPAGLLGQRLCESAFHRPGTYRNKRSQRRRRQQRVQNRESRTERRETKG
jgi:hypothetical protein